MGNIIIITVFSALASLIGTMIGASLGLFIKKPSKKFLGIMLGFAAGLMLGVVVFDLIPEAIENWGFLKTIIFSILGVIIVFLVDKLFIMKNISMQSSVKTALMTALALMLHNLPEGIIMGVGFLTGKTLGLKLSLIIAIHDIPEGMAVATPLLMSNIKVSKIMFYTFLTSLPTAVGACIGIFFGSVSQNSLSFCLSISSGIMLYVICSEMIPESLKQWNDWMTSLASIAGIMTGLTIINLI